MSFTNILIYDSDKKMKEYDELVEKFGLDKALEILSSTGDIYDGDVVEDKKNKTILDDETIRFDAEAVTAGAASTTSVAFRAVMSD